MLAQRLIWLGFRPHTGLPGEPPGDFRVQDDSDGRGPYIAEWLSALPQPSAAEIAAAEPPEPVPASVPLFKARIVLAAAQLPDGRSILEATEAAIAALPDGARLVATEAFTRAHVIHRASPLLNSLAADLGLSAEIVDGLFRAADELAV
ncbi:MAG TPA: XkdW family protein [Beijerinckiaceae bacterium]|nr:XkdW family protein [Beijerinckiaceae bacterium]